jgi:hypothetical protein
MRRDGVERRPAGLMEVSKLKAAVWSLTSLREKLIKVVSRGRYITFRIADVAANVRGYPVVHRPPAGAAARRARA